MNETLSTIGDALGNAFQMAWEVWWALILGFMLSGIVQAWVSRAQMERLLGGRALAATLRGTGLGAASSSCSYAAIAIAKSARHPLCDQARRTDARDDGGRRAARDALFSALGAIPDTRPSIESITDRPISLNYTAVLNAGFTIVGAALL